MGSKKFEIFVDQISALEHSLGVTSMALRGTPGPACTSFTPKCLNTPTSLELTGLWLELNKTEHVKGLAMAGGQINSASLVYSQSGPRWAGKGRKSPTSSVAAGKGSPEMALDFLYRMRNWGGTPVSLRLRRACDSKILALFLWTTA